jgi:hypothetical protein
VDYPGELLHGIAETRHLQLTGASPRKSVDHMSAALTDADSIVTAVESCSPDAQAALKELLRRDGRFPARAFARDFGEVRSFGPRRLARDMPWRQPANAAEELWYRGLIARGFAPLGDHTVEFVFVPSDVLPYLPLEAAHAPPFDVAAAPNPEVIQAADDCFLEDACTLLGFVQEGEAVVDHRGRWHAPALASLNQRLLRPASIESFDAGVSGDALALLLRLGRRLGWWHEAQRRLHLDDPSVRTWLQSEHSNQRFTLWSAWRDDRQWSDLCRVPGLFCEGTWQHSPLFGRRALLDHLGGCAAGLWYKTHDFVAAIKRARPDFLRPDGDYSTWYVRAEGSDQFLHGFEHWDNVEGAVIAYVLSGPAHWLGVVDVGGPASAFDRAEPLAGPAVDCPDLVFRLNSSGALMLDGATPECAGAQMPRLRVHPDFRVVAPHGTPCYDRFRLAYFTVWETSRPAFGHRITQRALRRAGRMGIDRQRIIAFLQRASGNDLPPNVLQALNREEKPA